LPNSSTETPAQLLFVYGSLKRGHANHEQLRSAEYLSRARTAASFALRVIDGYPALVPGTRAIEGELYRIGVQALHALDEFEGQAYVRREVALECEQRALAYLASEPDAGVPYPEDNWAG